jgi:trk system potassium uptake protein TrkA
VGQVVQRRYNTNCVVVRVLDPARAAFYAERGLRTVCPTQTAMATLIDVVRSCEPTPVGTS